MAKATKGAAVAAQATETRAHTTETIRERVVREERERQEAELARMREEREKQEREEAERKRREAERRAKEAEAAKERARIAVENARKRAEQEAAQRAHRRSEEIGMEERRYVLCERVLAILDELAAFRNGGGHYEYAGDFDKHFDETRNSVRYNMEQAKGTLLNPAQHFRKLGIAD